MMWVEVSQAEFVLDFQKDLAGSSITTDAFHSDGMGGGMGGGGGGGGGMMDSGTTLTDQTPYLRNGIYELGEIVTSSDGKEYYHMIMGSLADGFIQEVYIERHASQAYTWSSGMMSNNSAGTVSASGGASDFSNNSNNLNPLGSALDVIDSGNGSGNPTKVIIRQIVDDGEVMMEFLKDTFDGKPRITQTLNGAEITQQFDIDMRNITYSDMSSAAPMVNQMWLGGADVPSDGGFFDVIVGSGEPTGTSTQSITAGKYTYTDGVGFIGSDGNYTYSDGGSMNLNQDWDSWFDHTEANPWSYDTNRPVP